jgi:hypothetical protein
MFGIAPSTLMRARFFEIRSPFEARRQGTSNQWNT